MTDARRDRLEPDLERKVDDLVAALNSRERAGALDALFELDKAAIPFVTAAFLSECDAQDRATLVHVLWQFRDPVVLPALATALRDEHDRVWKEALDGLVTLGGTPALDVLVRARDELEGRAHVVRREWIDEAIDQVKASM